MRAVLVVVCLAGCLTARTVPCGDLECPVGSVCTAGGCTSPDQLAACDGLGEGATCHVGAIGGVCLGGACQLVICGDGKVVGPEQCDDGNQVANDGCSADCLSNETCGNGYIDGVKGEQCDDGLAGLSHDGCTSTCKVEIEVWRDVSPHLPSPRAGAAMAYDRRSHRAIAFGGTGSTLFDETWTWDGLAWRPLATVSHPPPRADHAMAYDVDHGVIVMFGGNGANGMLGDTWEFDGYDWHVRMPATSPPAGAYAAMAYDEARHVTALLVGSQFWTYDGTTWRNETPPGIFVPDGGAMAYASADQTLVVFQYVVPDTWIWNGTWTELGGLATQPQPRTFGMMSASSGGHVVLTGGIDGGGNVSLDTEWVWANGAWTEAAPSPRPSARERVAMTYDVDRDQVVLLGGEAQLGTILGDVWLRTMADQWQSVAEPTPAPRFSVPMAYVPERGVAVLYGGPTNETWEWDGLAWTQVTTLGPPPRIGHAMVAFDGTAIVYGSSTDAGTYSWDGATWTAIPTAHPPPARTRQAMTYDSARRRIVMFGGRTSMPIDETWEWDGTDWTQLAPAHRPSARINPAAAYDPLRGYTILFGGSNTAVLTDTWSWDGNDWTELAPATSPPKGFARAVYDPLRRTVVVLVVETVTGTSTLWEWTGTTWAQLAAENLVPPHIAAAMFYDARHSKLTIFGGTDVANVPQNDAWAHEFTNAAYGSELCTDVDTDGDSLVGCADPDCWARCTPDCPPRTTCAPDTPRCGDGTCASIEDPVLCPADCHP